MQLENPRYQYLLLDFAKWLKRMGACPSSQREIPRKMTDMLRFMEQREIQQIEEITITDIRAFFAYLLVRPNQRTLGMLSDAYYNSYLSSCKKLCEYLWHHYRIWLPIKLTYRVDHDQYPIVLTIDEIRQLYKVTQEDRLLCMRDQILLDVYYSCGLRRSEGRNIQLKDINLESGWLHVVRGKGYKQRYVPLLPSVIKRMEVYLQYSRPYLLGDKQHNYLLVGMRGSAMSGNGLYQRLGKLIDKTNNLDLKRKQIGLHSLRHSIATHLMKNGMSIYQIAKLLGHSSIETTQLYTHLAHPEKNSK